MKKIIVCLLSALLLLGCLSGCGDATISSSHDAPSSDGSTAITLSGDSANVSGGGATVNASVITISAAGTYTVSGTLNNGRIVVNTGDDPMKVRIILDGAHISCADGSAIEIERADDVKLYLADGSDNSVVSGTEADMALCTGESSGAAIHSSCDLDIRCDGNASLTVCGYINNGIATKKDLDIEGGNITVIAANTGIKGVRSVDITGAVINVTCNGDGIKATNAEKEGKGYVSVSGGSVTVNCGGDGISAESYVSVSGGVITINAENDPSLVSCKAIKAKTGVEITDGTLVLTSSDHCIHCTAGVSVSGGSLTLDSGAKGIAAHEDISISGGSLSIRSDSDGIETAANISISGGSIAISSLKDGIAAGDKPNGFTVTGGVISISGGSLSISAASDPVSAKASLTVSGGRVFGLGNGKNVRTFSADSAQGFLSGAITGSEGSTVSIGSDSITAVNAFRYFIYSDSSIVPGNEYTVSSGATSRVFTAE